MMTLWFLLMLGFSTLELFNPGLFFCLALALGAGCTMIAESFQWQPFHPYLIFFATSMIMFFILQSIVKLLSAKKQSKPYQSNIQLLIGQTIQVAQVISPTTGYAKIYGDTWPIKLQDIPPLHQGSFVQVTGVQGCHLIVRHLTNFSQPN